MWQKHQRASMSDERVNARRRAQWEWALSPPYPKTLALFVWHFLNLFQGGMLNLPVQTQTSLTNVIIIGWKENQNIVKVKVSISNEIVGWDRPLWRLSSRCCRRKRNSRCTSWSCIWRILSDTWMRSRSADINEGIAPGLHWYRSRRSHKRSHQDEDMPLGNQSYLPNLVWRHKSLLCAYKPIDSITHCVPHPDGTCSYKCCHWFSIIF